MAAKQSPVQRRVWHQSAVMTERQAKRMLDGKSESHISDYRRSMAPETAAAIRDTRHRVEDIALERELEANLKGWD